MNTARHRAAPDWDPRAPSVQRDQIAAYDGMRIRCPVAHSDYLHWSIFRHADVLRVIGDHETFSNRVSQHLSVPNGMDPPQHAAFRAIVERHFDATAMATFEPACRRIAHKLAAALPVPGEVELMRDFAHPFALEVQCAFMGWPGWMRDALADWMRENQRATHSGDRAAMRSVAERFDATLRRLFDERRAAGAAAPDDATTRLLRERVDGRALTDEEIVSIVRNWTAGELGTIAAAIGIVARRLAVEPTLQTTLRADRSLLAPAIDEVLRIDPPLIANRRVTTCPVRLGERDIAAGERISVMWAGANRDEAVFDEPDRVRLDRDPADNLLYGAGIHVCPGAPLARLELHAAIEALLERCAVLAPLADRPPHRAGYPAGGWDKVPLQLG
ncbi:cytochrome P450 [Pseudazoarcus pumilus]|uniref:Cytochrome P450 n=1 Tax=Pseudazoarcus pumilus TaxID=2067960 RepID=A0A2I6S4C4_9RHOO|nr:cytochrome P450 [Pseudazoarcus pumilus]AUN94102.1 cytochrome P450 [Pseudazoarcus pumilus]